MIHGGSTRVDSFGRWIRRVIIGQWFSGCDGSNEAEADCLRLTVAALCSTWAKLEMLKKCSTSHPRLQLERLERLALPLYNIHNVRLSIAVNVNKSIVNIYIKICQRLSTVIPSANRRKRPASVLAGAHHASTHQGIQPVILGSAQSRVSCRVVGQCQSCWDLLTSSFAASLALFSWKEVEQVPVQRKKMEEEQKHILDHFGVI